MTETDNCAICGGPVDGPNSARCDGCNRPYHLQVRMDTPGGDCGNVWIDDETLALRFACDTCLGRSCGIPTDEPPLGHVH